MNLTALIALSLISIDGGTQSRVAISDDVVTEYAEKMGGDVGLPPIVVFHDGSHYWLADGFHRFMAAKRIGLTEMDADVQAGTRRDAVLFAAGANTSHGLPRTNADKRRAVEMLLNDAEWAQWSDREIARRCGVHHVFVGDMRKSILVTNTSMNPERSFTHHKTGTPSTMRTENIGKRSPAPAPAPPAPVPTKPSAVSRGVGLAYANQAISFLNKIPPDDGLREEALDFVISWIEVNR